MAEYIDDVVGVRFSNEVHKDNPKVVVDGKEVPNYVYPQHKIHLRVDFTGVSIERLRELAMSKCVIQGFQATHRPKGDEHLKELATNYTKDKPFVFKVADFNGRQAADPATATNKNFEKLSQSEQEAFIKAQAKKLGIKL